MGEYVSSQSRGINICHSACLIPVTERTLPTFHVLWPDEFVSVTSAVPSLLVFIFTDVERPAVRAPPPPWFPAQSVYVCVRARACVCVCVCGHTVWHEMVCLG